MRNMLRAVMLLAAFMAVGWGAYRSVIRHASAATPVAEVRLSAGMAGLFAGGAAMVVVGIALTRLRR